MGGHYDQVTLEFRGFVDDRLVRHVTGGHDDVAFYAGYLRSLFDRAEDLLRTSCPFLFKAFFSGSESPAFRSLRLAGLGDSHLQCGLP